MTQKRFFTSDLHFGDKRLDLFGRDLVFKNSEEVDKTIVKNWNSVVGKDDVVIVLGDVALTKEGLENIAKCNGKKVLIKGNYDEKETAKYDVSDELLLKYFSKVTKSATITINGEKCYLNHYPTNGKEDMFNICGHIHGTWKVQRNQLNVGTDAWNYHLVPEEKVIFQMNGIRKHYDQNVFAGELDCNLSHKPKETEKEDINESKKEVETVGEINVLTPPKIESFKEQTIFLAGPIQGTSDWQAKAIKYLNKNRGDKTFKITSPRKTYKPEEFEYNKQVDWESHYLENSSKNGVIIFWLAKEKEHDPKRAYAQTSRFEIAEWLVKNHFDKKIKLMVGIEDGFSGDKYIRKRIKDDFKFIGKIYNNLDDLLKNALKELK